MRTSERPAPQAAEGEGAETSAGLAPRAQGGQEVQARDRADEAGRVIRVMGLDLSLTATGIACARHRWLVLDTPARKTCGLQRVRFIRDGVLEHTFEDGLLHDLVVLEGYSYGSKGNALFELGELGGVVKMALFEAGIPIVIVTPQQRAKFATGRGGAGKDEVIVAAVRRFGYEDERPNNNAADAWILRCMGLEQYQPGTFRLPAVHLEALSKVTWPREGGEERGEEPGPVAFGIRVEESRAGSLRTD